eukprot:1374393-Amorphochlora_amoeboformis.AAC.1
MTDLLLPLEDIGTDFVRDKAGWLLWGVLKSAGRFEDVRRKGLRGMRGTVVKVGMRLISNRWVELADMGL